MYKHKKKPLSSRTAAETTCNYKRNSNYFRVIGINSDIAFRAMLNWRDAVP